MVGLRSTFEGLTPEDAHAALKWLTATGKLSVKQIRDALKKRERLVAEIKAQLEALGGAGLRFLRGPESVTRKPARRRRRKPSAKAQAAWKAQGRYMAAVRRLSKANQAKVRAIREKKGVEAAIVTAKQLAKRRR